MSQRYPIGPQRLIHLRETSIVERLLDKAGGRFDSLLDCPSGHGRLSQQLKRRSRLLISSDLDRKSIALHSQDFKTAQESFLATTCNATHLPFKDAVFDGMITFRLFHHLRDEKIRLSIFREAARISRNFFLISYYENTYLHELSRSLHRNKVIRNRKKAFLDNDTIKEEAKQAGWHHAETCKVLPGIYAQAVTLFRKVASS